MKRIQRINLSEATYSAVREALVSEKYSPGGRIDIDELCQVLQVSRTPVFDALNRLEVEGIVEIIPRKGTYLVSFSKQKIQDLYAIREVLEGMATRLAATNITERQLQVLRKCLKEQAKCLKNAKSDGFAIATIRFHDTIVEAAGNKMLQRLIGTIYGQVKALRLNALYHSDRLHKSFSQHRQIFDALANRNPVICEREARNHIKTIRADVFEIMSRREKTKSSKGKLSSA